MNLQDRVAVVAGGGRAIGKTIALRLAREGAELVLAGPNGDELEQTASDIRTIGRRALPVVTDVSAEEHVFRLAERVDEEFGRCDVLVNNAAVVGPTARVPDISRADWDAVLAVNLTGAFLCCRAFLPPMMARRSGKVINISSIAGKMAYPLRSPYAVSKWGLIGLTMTLAKEMGEFNVQVNAVCPGPVEGERMQGIIKARAAETGRTVTEVQQEYTGKTVLGRFVTAEDVAALVAFLASDEAGNITGQALDVTAGYGL